jgi:hypothetical protein
MQSKDPATNASATSNVVTVHSALKYGWNAVSIPGVHDGTSLTDAFSDDVGTVYAYQINGDGSWTEVTNTTALNNAVLDNGAGFYTYSFNYTSALDSGLSENTAGWSQVDLPNTGNNIVGNPYFENVDWNLVKLCDGSASTFSASTGCSGGTEGTNWGMFEDMSDGGSISSATISGATKANPVVITASSHGFSNGDTVEIIDVVGMVEINARMFTIAGVTANTFELQGEDGTGHTAYTSGGTAEKQGTVNCNGWVHSTISYYANATTLTNKKCNATGCTAKMRSWWGYWVDKCETGAPAGLIMVVPNPTP